MQNNTALVGAIGINLFAHAINTNGAVNQPTREKRAMAMIKKLMNSTGPAGVLTIGRKSFLRIKIISPF